MRKLDYKKMKDNDFAKKPDAVYSMPQEAKISYAESGAIKVSFRGDQPCKVAMNAILKVLEQCEYGLLGNPVLYFYPVGQDAPKKKKQGQVDSWAPKMTVGQKHKEIPADDGTIPWT